LGSTKGLSIQDAKSLPPTINMKFRIHDIDRIKEGILVFITVDNLTKGRIISAGDIALLNKASGGKFIASWFSLPRYLVYGDKVRGCIMGLESIKVVCASGQYKSGTVPQYIDIFINSSKAFYPVPNIWRSLN